MTGGIRATIILVLLTAAGCAPSNTPVYHWTFENPGRIGDRDTTMVGSPGSSQTSRGPAMTFDGEDDGMIVDVHPLAGTREFTAEVVLLPRRCGSREQRFVHVQEHDSSNRILFELRRPVGDTWFLDTYIKTGGKGHTLFAKDSRHPYGSWYHAAIVVVGGRMSHYVNRELEMSTEIDFNPPGPGRTSLGMRMDAVDHFCGALREVRFTWRALDPDEFLQAP